MAKVRFIGDMPLLVPELGDRLVQPDEIYTVPDARYDAYMLHPDRWESIEEPAAPLPAPAAKAAAKTTPKTGTTPAATGTTAAADPAAPTTPTGAES